MVLSAQGSIARRAQLCSALHDSMETIVDIMQKLG